MSFSTQSPAIDGRPLVATFSRAALIHNGRRARLLSPAGGQVLGVIKADAYGHGLLETAAALKGAVDGYAVLELAAARMLRQHGYQAPILMLEGFYSAAELVEFAALGLTAVVHRLDQIETLAGMRLTQPVPVFLKLNSGMNRLGIALAEARSAYDRLQSLPQVASVTVMTHFADADNTRGTAWQLDRLRCAWPEVMGTQTSFANSAALLCGPATRDALGDVVRPGIMLYGASPWGGMVPGKTSADLDLKPVMTLRSALIAIQEIQAGERVGYGGIFTADRPMRIGVVACGYADGYPRHATGDTPILVDGQRTTLTGRVSMDRLCCDVTAIPGARVGSPVTLWGEALPADEIADSAGTIAYELFCALSPRVPRLWQD
jgi:alanine racemase